MADAAGRKLRILSAAMGVSNGGQIRADRKGLAGAMKVDRKDVTVQPWTHAWIMPGKAKKIFTPAGVDRVAWAR